MLTFRDFFNIKSSVKDKCGIPHLTDFEGRAYCNHSIDDMSNNLLFDRDIYGRVSKGSKILYDIGSNLDIPFPLSKESLMKASKTTIHAFCKPIVKGKKSFYKEFRRLSHNHYSQCFRGIALFKRELEPFSV